MMEPCHLKKAVYRVVDLGLLEYQEALARQEQYVAAKKAGTQEEDILMVLEHPAVFTLGRRGGRENLVVSDAFLAQRHIPVIQTGRGGNITFHGPGQLVVYPILDLKRADMGVAEFVHLLEEVMIATAADAGVTASRNALNHGIWVENRKIGSIGLSISRDICFHGLALNVNLDLTPFSWVNPCGLSNISMTSLEKEGGQKISMETVKASLLNHLTRRLWHRHGRTGIGSPGSAHNKI